MKVVLVHEHDFDVRVLQLPCGSDAGEATTEDHDTRRHAAALRASGAAATLDSDVVSTWILM